jgi:adenylate cyclase
MSDTGSPALPGQGLTEHEIAVLLVDDQPMIGEAVRRMVADQSDIRFHYCQDPSEAIARALEVRPTVILQDLVMPEIDGMTLVRFFRANPQTREIPLIVLSTKEEPEVKAQAFGIGANDYMVKLPDKLEMIARIRYHSKGYISMLQRNEAFAALVESQKQLEVRNRFIRETFGRYLSDEIVSSLLESPAGLELGGEKRKVTIMMTDLRGFTSISERLPPEKVVRVINNFLETMTEIIVRHSGTIDEFIGDAILVIFGAPISRPDDAERAAACAVQMQLAMKDVNERNRAEGLPAVEMGIGVNTGEVVVGNIGSKKRTKYGVVGSAVNVTSRIESYTVGGQILISEQTHSDAGPIVETAGELLVSPKGVKAPITIYDVVGIGGRWNQRLPSHEDRFTPLAEAIPVRYVLFDEKDTGGAEIEGSLLALAVDGAELRCGASLRPLSNLRIRLAAGGSPQDDVYAKTLARAARNPSDAVIRFTSVPAEVGAWLAARREADAKGARPAEWKPGA